MSSVGIDTQQSSMPSLDMNQQQMPQDDFNDIDSETSEGNDEGKKEIQQLCGKLSQKLDVYNQSNQGDVELNKYVAGMIIPQATKGMSEEDKNDVINKINKDTDDGDGNLQQQPTQGEQPQMPMESINRIEEIIDSVIDDEARKRGDKKNINKNLKRNNPFISNR